MSLPTQAAKILRYWSDLGPKGWYAGGAALDRDIEARFADTWREAARGGFLNWQSCPRGMLAYLLVTDQFPRNMFRGDARAFATDARARAVASRAWQHKSDLDIDSPLRQFFYLPFMHAESSFDQNLSVCLVKARLPAAGDTMRHALAHREIIRRFRRFPYRNAALGRENTAAEETFLSSSGYAEILHTLGG